MSDTEPSPASPVLTSYVNSYRGSITVNIPIGQMHPVLMTLLYAGGSLGNRRPRRSGVLRQQWNNHWQKLYAELSK